MKNSKTNKTIKIGKSRVTLLALALALVFVVGGTAAYLLTKSATVTNTFTPAQVSCEVNSTATGIKNTSNIKVYLRAAVTGNWMTGTGSNTAIYVEQGAPRFTMTVDTDNWEYRSADGYYYCRKLVAPGEEVPLFTSTGAPALAEGQTAPSGYTFTYEIGAQCIQWQPDAAVTEAWGFVPTVTNSGN